MAQSTEEFVEEWFNRNGYFTIRGLKDKVQEIDILAIKMIDGVIDCVHCEVQVSFNAVNYITRLTKEIVDSGFAPKSTSSKERPPEILEICAKEWVQKKYFQEKKQKVKDSLVPNQTWRPMFVHGQVKHSEELAIIKSEGIETISFETIMSDLLSFNTEYQYTGSKVTDLINAVIFSNNL